MIGIHDTLWAVTGSNRTVPDSDFLLAYMTYADYTKDGSPSTAFEKRKKTGTSWASSRSHMTTNFNINDHIMGNIPNKPMKGFKVVGSATRWSTSNKVIRVEDPRGFVVEIPTDNLTTLLSHCTIRYREIEEECVWGRDSSNHILLPVNSDIYREAVEQKELQGERISFSMLSVGDIVKLSADSSTDYLYHGKAKATWEIIEMQRASSHHRLWTRTAAPITEVSHGEVTDDKWNHVFSVHSESRWKDTLYRPTGKAIVTGNIDTSRPEIDTLDISAPDRLIRPYRGSNYNYAFTSKLTKLTWKD